MKQPTSATKMAPGAYFGIWPAGVLAAGAVAAGAAGVAAAGAAGVVGMAPAPVDGAGATGTVLTLSITPPPTDEVRALAMYDRPSVALKKIAAATPVDFDMKFDEPVAPNRLPEAPEPKAAPMSAPLPCCSNTNAMIAKADKTCTTTTKLNNVFITIPFSV